MVRDKWFKARLKECCEEVEKEACGWFARIPCTAGGYSDTRKQAYVVVVFRDEEIISGLSSEFIINRMRKGIQLMGAKLDKMRPTNFLQQPVIVTVCDQNNGDGAVEVRLCSYAEAEGEGDEWCTRGVIDR